MQTLNIIGFETGNLDELYINSGGALETTTVRSGGYSYRCNPVTSGTAWGSATRISESGEFDGSSVGTEISYTRFYVRFAAFPSTEERFFYIFDDADTTSRIKSHMRITSGGVVKQYQGSGTLVGTASTTLSLNTWYRIELYLSDVDNLFELRIDGNTEASGAHSTVFGDQYIWTFGKRNDLNGSGYDAFYDDIQINDYQWPGPGEVKIMRPAGDGSPANFTANGAANKWDCLDDRPHDSDTTYISTLNNTDKYYATLESTTTAGITAMGVIKVVNYHRRSGGPGVTQTLLKASLKSNGSELNTVYGLTEFTSYSIHFLMSDYDPSGSPWGASNLDAIQIGVIDPMGSGSREIRVTALYLMVDNGGYIPVINMQGRFTITGLANVVPTYNYLVSGKLLYTGLANIQASYNYLASGRLIVAGIGSFRASFSVNPLGQLSLSGLTTSAIGIFYRSEGRLLFTGLASVTSNFTVTATGILFFTGIATANSFSQYSHDAVGQIFFLGLVTLPKVTYENYNSFGGLLFSGLASASSSSQFDHNASGALYITGVAFVQVTYDNLLASGQLLFSGSQEELNSFFFYPTGILYFSGIADAIQLSADYNYNASGKLEFKGKVFEGEFFLYEANGLLTFCDPTLVLWIRFEEGTGFDYCYDSSIYHRDAVMYNLEYQDWKLDVSPLFYEEKSHFSLNFRGSNEHLKITQVDGLMHPNFTITVWVNPNSLPG